MAVDKPLKIIRRSTMLAESYGFGLYAGGYTAEPAHSQVIHNAPRIGLMPSIRQDLAEGISIGILEAGRG